MGSIPTLTAKLYMTMPKLTVKEIAMLGALLDQEIEKQKKLSLSSDMGVQWTAIENRLELKALRIKIATMLHETE